MKASKNGGARRDRTVDLYNAILGEKRTGGRVNRAFQGAGWSLRHPLRAWGAAFSGGLSFWDHLLLVVITGVVLGALLSGALVLAVAYQAEILTFLAEVLP